MLRKGIFQKPSNELEGQKQTSPVTNGQITIGCPVCHVRTPAEELSENLHVCPRCGYHFRMNARQRIDFLTDDKSFEELFGDLTGEDILHFPEYDKKLRHARLESAEEEGVVCGTATIGGRKTALFVMEPYFMMGSMGCLLYTSPSPRDRG